MPPPGQACDDSHLYHLRFSFLHFYSYMYTIAGLEITLHVDNALVFYFGPMTYNPKLGIQDFMSLKLQQGFAIIR